MRKFLALALLCAALFPCVAESQAVWKSVDLPIRSRDASYAAPGNRDSVKATFGSLAAIDTTVNFAPGDWAAMHGAAADTLCFVAVQIITDNAMASGESLYVSLEGSAGADNDATGQWFSTYSCTPATSLAGGFSAAACVTGAVRGGVVVFNGGSCGTGTSGAQTSLQAGGKAMYGGWLGFPVLRVKVRTDSAVVPVVNTYRVRMWYFARP